MAALLAAVGFAVGEVLAPGDGGVPGLGAGLLLWGILGLVAYGSGDTIFLGLVGARKIEKQDHPVLWNVVEEMTIAAGLAKMPDVYIIDKDALNAFATGRGPDRASIAVTSGLLENLDRDELQGVVAHELGHVKNRDVLYLLLLGAMALVRDPRRRRAAGALVRPTAAPHFGQGEPAGGGDPGRGGPADRAGAAAGTPAAASRSRAAANTWRTPAARSSRVTRTGSPARSRRSGGRGAC